MRKLILPLFLLSSLTIAQAQDVEIQPITGAEYVTRINPEPYSIVRLFYGLRASYKMNPFVAEVEYIKGTHSKNFLSSNTKIEEDSQAVKLGIGLNADLSGIDVTLRGGAQAKQIETTKTVSSVVTKSKSDWMTDPYLGLDISYSLGKSLKVGFSGTAVLSDYPQKNKVDYQAGLTLKLAYGMR